MPPGAPFDSVILPYDCIRVDAFATPNRADFKHPALYLLTHTHSDHLVGLDAKSFGGIVVCSETAKEMLLRLERTNDRIDYDNDVTLHKGRPYSHLKIEPKLVRGKLDYSHARDLLRAIPLNKPTEFKLSPTLTVWITAIDANHCPGAVMFLVDGPYGAVLHTGDVRAEPWFVESLTRNPHLQQFIPLPQSIWPPPEGSPIRMLEAVYIDTAMLVVLRDLPPKEQAASDLVDLMELLDPSTTFYLNAWTWGYEDIFKAVGRRFNSKIHFDRYKADIYGHGEDLFMKSIVTTQTDTRFHACERLNRCSAVIRDSANIVYVHPTEMSTANWEVYKLETRERLLRGEKVTSLIVPLSRHSGLIELQALASLFKPKKVVPNFLLPGLNQLDWISMPNMFEQCVAPGGADRMRLDIQAALPLVGYVSETTAEIKNIALENAVGEDTKEIVMKWSSKEPLHGQNELVTRLLPFLPKEIRRDVEENCESIFEDNSEKPEPEGDAGSSDDEGDAHNQDWRAIFLGLQPDARGKVPRIEGDSNTHVQGNRMLLLDYKDGESKQAGTSRKDATLQGPQNKKRKRELEESSTGIPSKKQRRKSPEVIIIDDSSSSPRPSSKERSYKPNTVSANRPLQSDQTMKRPITVHKEKAKELKARISIAKRQSNVGIEAGALTIGHGSRLSVAWSQAVSTVVASSSQEAELLPPQAPTKLNPREYEPATKSDIPNQTPPLPGRSLELPQGVDLNKAKSLLNQLIADKGDWAGLSCIGSQTQTF